MGLEEESEGVTRGGGICIMNRGGPSASSVYATVTCTGLGAGVAKRACRPHHTKRLGRRARCMLRRFNMGIPLLLSGLERRVGGIRLGRDRRVRKDLSVHAT